MEHAQEYLRNTAGWGPSEWIAFGMLAIAMVTMIAGGLIAVARFSHQMGRHDERLDRAEEDIKNLRAAEKLSDDDRAELKAMAAILSRVEKGLGDVGHVLGRRMDDLERDIRRWLAGRQED